MEYLEQLQRRNNSRSDYVLGLEKILNNPNTNFVSNSKVFNEIHKQSGMTINNMIRHIGKKVKSKKNEEPTDDQRIKERLAVMEQSSA